MWGIKPLSPPSQCCRCVSRRDHEVLGGTGVALCVGGGGVQGRGDRLVTEASPFHTLCLCPGTLQAQRPWDLFLPEFREARAVPSTRFGRRPARPAAELSLHPSAPGVLDSRTREQVVCPGFPQSWVSLLFSKETHSRPRGKCEATAESTGTVRTHVHTDPCERRRRPACGRRRPRPTRGARRNPQRRAADERLSQGRALRLV